MVPNRSMGKSCKKVNLLKSGTVSTILLLFIQCPHFKSFQKREFKTYLKTSNWHRYISFWEICRWNIKPKTCLWNQASTFKITCIFLLHSIKDTCLSGEKFLTFTFASMPICSQNHKNYLTAACTLHQIVDRSFDHTIHTGPDYSELKI